VLRTLIRRTVNDDRAAEASREKTAPSRPLIGLALGGGAARGFAHIGLLRTLLAHDIQPDVVVGTSIGAVAGACFVTGNLDTFEAWAHSLTKRGVLGYLDISLSGSGLIGGKRLGAQLEKTFGDMLIEDLPVRFAAIATELHSGHEI
jgi:NTE family protein